MPDRLQHESCTCGGVDNLAIRKQSLFVDMPASTMARQPVQYMELLAGEMSRACIIVATRKYDFPCAHTNLIWVHVVCFSGGAKTICDKKRKGNDRSRLLFIQFVYNTSV